MLERTIPIITKLLPAFFCSDAETVKEIGIQEPGLPDYDYSAVPRAVVDDAVRRAREAAGGNTRKAESFIRQALATYVEACDKDIVIFYNSGGWGWNRIHESEGWTSILEGIESKLAGLGYRTLVLNYRRTGGGFRGCFGEFREQVNHYPRKPKDLASRIEFLTASLPALRVIIAGESSGTIIAERTMSLLRRNPRVFSIQTGMPFWHKPEMKERSLLVTNNGRGHDMFSEGKVRGILWATFRDWLGLSSPNENPGKILSWLKAPGHHYSWQYPGVSSRIEKFLENNFGKKAEAGFPGEA